jgi:hypothetical protein
MFGAFDPRRTCLRYPRASFHYFSYAERSGLIGINDASNLSRNLIRCYSTISEQYKGHFSSYFCDPSLEPITYRKSNPAIAGEDLLLLGNPWVDLLFEACPWPVFPERHFRTRLGEEIDIQKSTQLYADAIWPAWAETLDTVCLGPWFGLTPEEILQIVNYLNAEPGEYRKKLPVQDGRRFDRIKISVPYLSQGFQGVLVAAIDRSFPKRDAAISAILQFGQTLADAYASLRASHFKKVVAGEFDAEKLAHEIVNLVSPVESVVVDHQGVRFGLELQREHNYLAGYARMPPNKAQLCNMAENAINIGALADRDIWVKVEPIRDVPDFDLRFASQRILSTITRFMTSVQTGSRGGGLSLREAKRVHESLQEEAGAGKASIARLRQLYIAEKICGSFGSGTARIMNHEVKSFLEKRLKRKLSTGYQVSSHPQQIERLYEGRVSVSTLKHGLTVTWSRRS